MIRLEIAIRVAETPQHSRWWWIMFSRVPLSHRPQSTDTRSSLQSNHRNLSACKIIRKYRRSSNRRQSKCISTTDESLVNYDAFEVSSRLAHWIFTHHSLNSLISSRSNISNRQSSQIHQSSSAPHWTIKRTSSHSLQNHRTTSPLQSPMHLGRSWKRPTGTCPPRKKDPTNRRSLNCPIANWRQKTSVW